MKFRIFSVVIFIVLLLITGGVLLIGLPLMDQQQTSVSHNTGQIVAIEQRDGWMDDPSKEGVEHYQEEVLPEWDQVEDSVLSSEDQLPKEWTFWERLSSAALERTTHRVTYDGAYVEIDYPWGDVAPDKGVCTDVVIRSYRSLGIDLQKEVHEDIRRHFRLYPSKKKWGLSKPDSNIDHRRVPNLQVFLNRKGVALPITDNPEDYVPGDLVTWLLPGNKPHIGIVVDQRAYSSPDRYLIAHNLGEGPVLEDILFRYEIDGHFRYQPEETVVSDENRTGKKSIDNI